MFFNLFFWREALKRVKKALTSSSYVWFGPSGWRHAVIARACGRVGVWAESLVPEPSSWNKTDAQARESSQ